MKPASDNSAQPPGRSWRSIRQDVSSPAMSSKGRRRKMLAWMKAIGIGISLGAAGWGIYTLAHSWETDRAGLASAVHSAPVKDVVLITDGVLSQKWVTGVLALPKGASLMALDLPALRNKLTAFGQIKMAVLTRNFPDTLVVNLQERTPVARVQANDSFGTKQYMVARDGVAYEGINYDKNLVASLPWLGGVRLVKSGAAFQPIDGMADVSSLLTTAQLQAPHLYRNWLVVSLERLAEADEIMVKAQDVPQVIFSRKRDYFTQIAQLDTVIDAVQRLPDPMLQSVNLTLENQVPVRLQGASPEQLASLTRPELSFQPSQRKTKRDL